jgi:hypothetical protein
VTRNRDSATSRARGAEQAATGYTESFGLRTPPARSGSARMRSVSEDGQEGEDQPTTESGRFDPSKLTVSLSELERFAEAARLAKPESSPVGHGASAESTRAGPAGAAASADLVAVFLGALGVGSLFVLPLRFALLTLAVAALLVAVKLHDKSRLGGLVVAGGIFISACGVWVFGGSPPSEELTLGKTRLAVVNEINLLRAKRHVDPLDFDPGLSVLAQQQADYAAAAHTGLATKGTAGELPSRETNMWAEMAGVSCSVQHLFEVSRWIPKKDTAPPTRPELGFIEMGAEVGRHKGQAILSPSFRGIGVGLKYLPKGAISIQIDVSGPFKAGEPWLHTMPNLVSMVVGGAPECG